MDYYPVPSHQQTFELEIKRSRFITTVAQITDQATGKAFIQSVRDTYPDANHHCWAMLAGRPDDLFQQNQSDDGEPKGTAGKPMLNVLQHSALGNTAIVVTRYFGGIKLGAGGLVRAYSLSASNALKQLETKDQYVQYKWLVKLPYALFDSLEHKLRGSSIHIGQTQFHELIHVEIMVPKSKMEQLEKLLIDLGSGSIEITRSE